MNIYFVLELEFGGDVAKKIQLNSTVMCKKKDGMNWLIFIKNLWHY